MHSITISNTPCWLRWSGTTSWLDVRCNGPPRPPTMRTSLWPASPITFGYVRGIIQGDEDGAYVADLTGRKIELPVGSSDAALAPYHVDRSKLFVIERLDAVEEVDVARIARAIEYTRFPYIDTPKGEIDDLNEEEGLLLRA